LNLRTYQQTRINLFVSLEIDFKLKTLLAGYLNDLDKKKVANGLFLQKGFN
jgi:hypothetical protein